MNCDRVNSLICEYVGGCLSPAQRREIEEHLRTCPACRSELESVERMVTCLGSLSGHRSPVDCWTVVRARIEARESEGARWLLWLVRPAVAAPAMAVMLLLAMFLLGPAQVGDAPGRDPSSMPEYSQYVTAHSRLQRQQAFTDPDVTFVAAEFEKSSVEVSPTRP